MCRRIIKLKRSTLGTTIVFRSPIKRAWLFNITIAPKRETLAHVHTWTKEYDGAEYCQCGEYKHNLEVNTELPKVLGKIGYAFTLCAIALLFLGA